MKKILQSYPALAVLLCSGLIAAAEPDPARLIISVSEWPTMFPERSTTTGEKMVPGVEIFSDGTTIIKRSNKPEIVKRMTHDQLQKLLKVLVDAGVFKISKEKIAAEIEAVGPLPAPTDNPETILFVAADGSKVTISQYAFTFFAGKYPTVEGLQVMRRCIEIVHEAVGDRPGRNAEHGADGKTPEAPQSSR